MLEDKTQANEIQEFLELLIKYGQDERYSDNNRCLLAENLNFDVCSLYNYILFNFSVNNNFHENNITFSTFKNFLKIILNIKVHDKVLSKFFAFYSPKMGDNNEQYLEYVQFSEIFYPRYNYHLRKFLQYRTCLNNNIKSIDNTTKQLLRKLFVGEFKKINNIINTLNTFKYINNNDIFKRISNDKKIITKYDIINYINLYENKIIYKEEDINSIIISLSINKDYNNEMYNIKEGITEDIFNNIFNINNNSTFSISFQDFVFNNEETDHKALFISLIKRMIQQEKKIEESKILLISRNDFDINNIISLFINNKKDKIGFDYFLEKLNIGSLNNFEKELLLRRIDSTRKGYINKNDLFYFFVPFSKLSEFNNYENNNEYTELNLSKGTMIYIKNLIYVTIKEEKEINSKKKELNEAFVENIFDEIANYSEVNNTNFGQKDNISIDFFNKEMLYKYLTEKLNLKIHDDEANLLFFRFDKFKRGKIKMLEFLDELNYIRH